MHEQNDEIARTGTYDRSAVPEYHPIPMVKAVELPILFGAKALAEARAGRYSEVVTTVAGHAWVKCIKQHAIDPTDPFKFGHTPPDKWIGQG